MNTYKINTRVVIEINNYSTFGFGYDSDTQYDVAQICLNGHLVNEATKKSPQFSSKYCGKCGQPTIDKCPLCKSPIASRYQRSRTPSMSSSPESPVPFYCHDCGKPYPWTQTIIDTTIELISGEDELTPEDKKIITENLPDIISQTPRTPLAASRVRKTLEGMSGAGKEVFKQLLSDNVTESAKLLIWP
ncbi:MAG: hypothetical protein APF84_12320 [Gracilibacter sp. BRH_c7a]|nr:MAG: hypothetical protein APF84_12320 [Gracilibacter sp. BRH_c7a]